MSLDPLQLIVASRPTWGDLPEAGDGVTKTNGTTQRARNVMREGDLNMLSALPGSASYAERQEILKAQARARGEPEAVEIVDQPEGLILPDSIPAPAVQVVPVVPPTPTKRVAIYYGKSDTYNVAVESAPEWDTDKMFKGLDEQAVTLLLDLAQALGLRVSDKTGDFSG